MTHKCKFVRHRNRRSRRHMSYKCHECFLVLVVRKRSIHRMLTRPGYGYHRAHLVTARYYDTRDPRYAEYAWRELFSYEAVHAE